MPEKLPVVTREFVEGRRVLLRADLDALTDGRVEDFRLEAGLLTLEFCLRYAKQVIMMGHLGRPGGKVVPELLVEPVRQWFSAHGFAEALTSGKLERKLEILENLRFNPGEDAGDLKYARELAAKGDVLVYESFATYRPAASTTVLPGLLPHVVGFRFQQEVKRLSAVRENPKKPCVVIMGGAKVDDKLPVICALAPKADVVLVGGKLIQEVRTKRLNLPDNVMVGTLTKDGFDITFETTQEWTKLIRRAKTIIWNGPLGRFEVSGNDQTKALARAVLDSEATVVIGGGNTIDALNSYGLFKKAQKKAFVSVGGGAMLKFLADGTLPTIQALT